MADNRLGLRCAICHKVITIARLSAGDADWTPSRNDPNELAAFLIEHANWCGEGTLHVDLQGENNHKLAVVAAAPELLEALKDAAQTARNYYAMFHDETWRERLAKLDAAIAKAEGR